MQHSPNRRCSTCRLWGIGEVADCSLRASVAEECRYAMPNKGTKARRRERQQKLAAENEDLRQRLQSINAYNRPPYYRPQTSQWDWQCSTCSYLVYGGKTECRCGEKRWNGRTIPGSVRGVMQSNSDAAAATAMQTRVPSSRSPARQLIGAQAGGRNNAPRLATINPLPLILRSRVSHCKAAHSGS